MHVVLAHVHFALLPRFNWVMRARVAENKAVKESDIHVPGSFDMLPELLCQVHTKMVEKGGVVEEVDTETPTVPLDFTWAKKLRLVR